MKTKRAIMTVLILAIISIAFTSKDSDSVADNNAITSKALETISEFGIVKDADMLISMEQDTSIWLAPTEADNVKNTITSNEESINEGMLIYKKHCRSCHGKKGDGLGLGAEDCNTKPTDFSQPTFTGQSDGAIYWKMNEGRNDMESYKGELEEEEIWKVILYIRTFAGEEGE